MLSGFASILTNTVLNYASHLRQTGLPGHGGQRRGAGDGHLRGRIHGYEHGLFLWYAICPPGPGPPSGCGRKKALQAVSAGRLFPSSSNEGLWAVGTTMYTCLFMCRMGDAASGRHGRVHQHINDLVWVAIFALYERHRHHCRQGAGRGANANGAFSDAPTPNA